MFESKVETIEPLRVTHYRILDDGVVLTFANVLNRWQFDEAFRGYFISLLQDSSFSGYRWETPSVTIGTVDRPFEFVLINTPGFATRRPDSKTYARYFTDADDESGIVTFTNLGGDATLIVPSPRTVDSAYGHLAAFVRNAPRTQVDGIWRTIGAQVESRIGEAPLWLSTAGGGVAWLHVRLDAQPKYYGHAAYRTA